MASVCFTCGLTYDLSWFLGFTLLFCFVYQFVLKTWWYFDQRNLKFVRGLPLLGCTYRSLFGLDNIATNIKAVYDTYPNERIIGVYNFGGSTSYLLRDPDLIKQVTITNFDHFVNHGFEFPEGSEPLMAGSLVILRNEKWRRMRSTMTPAFTGSKMRLMHGLIVDTTKDFVDSLAKVVDAGTNVFDSRDLFHRFTNDVIGNCVFGITINSMEDKDNEFYKCGKSICNFEGMIGFKLMCYSLAPKLMKFLKIRVFDQAEAGFFRSMIMNNIDQRIKSKIVRNDMLDLLIKARDGSLSHDPEDEGQKSGAALDSESNNDKHSEPQTLKSGYKLEFSQLY